MKEEIEVGSGSSSGPRPRRISRRAAVLAIVAAAMVAMCLGLLVWHEQPSFCNAICHSPMDKYVEGFYAEDGCFLSAEHRSADIDCLDCHTPTIDQQVTEAVAWASGTFSEPLAERKIGTRDFCLNDGCHADFETETVADTEDYLGSGRNPHSAHVGDLDCNVCHSMHRESSLYCVSCHADMPSPEDWK